MKAKLSASMTQTEFDNGYWYAAELKEFAKEIGIPSSNKLRKDELDKAILRFLATGKAEAPTKRNLKTKGVKDIELGLSVNLPIMLYTSNKVTKKFIEAEARKLAPKLKWRSGARYRLNRWREEQMLNGRKITYGDLVREYVRLSVSKEPFAHIPHGRYINFLSDYLVKEKNATRKQAMKEWHKLKRLNIPKDYGSWKSYRKSMDR